MIFTEGRRQGKPRWLRSVSAVEEVDEVGDLVPDLRQDARVDVVRAAVRVLDVVDVCRRREQPAGARGSPDQGRQAVAGVAGLHRCAGEADEADELAQGEGAA